MCGAIYTLPNTPPRRGAQLKKELKAILGEEYKPNILNTVF
jgi:hypothetical protein